MRGGRTDTGRFFGAANIRPVYNSRESKKMSKLVLDQANKKILGVCAGLANWTGMDVMIVRLLFVAATLIGVGSPILIYIALGLILN